MEQLLQPIDTPTSLFLYRDPGSETWICTDYDKLTELLVQSLFESNQDHRLMANWTYAPSHPLIFEIPLTEKTEKNTFDFLMRYVHLVFLPVLHKHVPLPELTLLLAMGQSLTTGLRIHVVGVELSHDDYWNLCVSMRNACAYHEEDFAVYLEISSQFPLPSCDRPGGTGDLYKPVRLLQVRYGFYEEHGVWRSYRLKHLSIEPKDRDSPFSRLVNHPEAWKHMARLMMPVPQPNAIHLHFPASIHTGYEAYDRSARGEESVASLKSYLNEKTYSIQKESVLQPGKNICYEFLKENANHIRLIHAHHPLFRAWYVRFRDISPHDLFLDKKHVTCEDVDRELRKLCPHLKNEASPLAKVLETHERPVYYALCHLTQDVAKIREHFPFLSSDLPSQPPPEARHLNFDTILHCAYRTGEGSFVAHVVAGLDWIVATTTTVQHVINHILWIQKRAFPIVYGPEKAYSWSPTAKKWLALDAPIRNVMDIFLAILEILSFYFPMSSELLNEINKDRTLEAVVNDILRESSDKRIMDGNRMTEPPEVYGLDVPQYYFFDKTE